MLFKRRDPQGLSKILRELLWPTMGWRRALSYYHHRLFRQSDATYRIAGGLATGAAVSFTPLLGTHYLQSILWAHILRQSKIAAMIGTYWGNPWTLPPMFYFDYVLGVWLMELFGGKGSASLPEEHTFSYLISDPMQLFLPMLIGGIICAILSWPVAYLIVYYPVDRLRRAYRLRRLKQFRFRKYRRA